MLSFSDAFQETISPHDQKPVPGTRKEYPTEQQIDAIIANAVSAQRKWRDVAVSDRLAIGNKFLDLLTEHGPTLAKELSLQMGRPVSQALGEIKGTHDRGEYMLSIAETSLADVSLKSTDKPGFKRFIRKEPVGVVFVVAPWNFPYLTTINSVVPALMAGNAVLLKPSPQTPLTADRFQELFKSAGLPEDLLIPLHLSPKLTRYVAAHPQIGFVSFTGSVTGGLDVQKAALAGESPGMKGVALELGGKDPAYVRADANLEYSIGEIVDGAFFNSGQSCCAVERVYVHESLYDRFVSGFIDLVKKYKLGDPSEVGTNLGPVISVQSAERIRKQIDDAVKMGAKKCIDEQRFQLGNLGPAYVAPQVLIDVNHNMSLMTEETFGPVVGIMKVTSDKEALALMNDSRYGLTASLWSTSDPSTSSDLQRLISNVEAGTVFVNRCDYLDPALAWGGVKDSGRGVSLSTFGYDQLTRLKSVHLKLV